MTTKTDSDPPVAADQNQAIVMRDEADITELLRSHGEALGRNGKPASRQLLMDAADEIEQLRDGADGMREGFSERLDGIIREVASVLMLMDGLAEQSGDEGVFRRCRDRLRSLVSA